MKIFTIILALLIPQMALARIGETKEQCDERYGEPTSVDGVARSYQKGAFTIILYIVDGKCHGISYTKTDGSEISDKELQTLRSVNGAGSWHERGDGHVLMRTWTPSNYDNGDDIALYDRRNRTFSRVTARFQKYAADEASRDAKKSTDGL